METLADFVWRRMKELTVLEAEVRAQLDALNAERDQLRRAALAAGFEADAAPEQERPRIEKAQEPQRVNPVVRKIPSVTLKQAVLIVLGETRKAMPASDILDAINRRFNADFPRTSLSPQLSRLKGDELLALDGQNWTLTEAGNAAAESLVAKQQVDSLF